MGRAIGASLDLRAFHAATSPSARGAPDGEACWLGLAVSAVHEGGCLCGDVRYRTRAQPLRVTICHCTFCQRFTGSAFLVEPIFRRQDVAFHGVVAKSYDHQSDSSRKRVTLKFCGRCGTTICLDLQRFPDILGLCGGTFDDPNWFDRSQCRHIFTRSAQAGVVLPAGVALYQEHALLLDGTPTRSTVLAHALMVARQQDPRS
jgi:hypothetical protein